MDYVREIRKKIGHDPLILAGAAVLVINQQGHLLMMRRTDIPCWGIPGGGMEPGESLEETAARETLEETGLRVGSLKLLDVFSGPELIFQYPNGDIVCNVSAVYVTHDTEGEIILDREEHIEWQYFPLEQLPEDICPPIRCVLDTFMARNGRKREMES